ncbi:hypothetical protein JDV02_004482 [Purpureocillium takamizusanense]|uniref:Rhodopsin domain-containing protein n=1 Tax=Purpureocillium takamizusanense TaxID=2060973 RepID=A0A9Q8VAT9_9HYPO|nr:uncharacterized protein JDV02_004482 [Purpureocillium takamizusanense]UNI18199.1 hypothetical protein JDV02_004482 [Purpureocillium takamizusanense]
MARDFPESAEAAEWRQLLAGVSIGFGSFATIAFLMRVFASRMVSAKVRLDDVLMGCAVLLMWGDVAAVLLKAFNGVGVAAQDLPHYRQIRFNIGSWLVTKFWATSQACVKLSIIIFIRRVLGLTRPVVLALKVVFASVVVWGIFAVLYTTFMCRPVSFYWDRTIPGGSCIPNEQYESLNIFSAIVAAVADITILIIPTPTIWRLRIRRKQKIAVQVVLCVGLIVCIFSALRVVQFFTFNTNHLSTSTAGQSLWTILENELSILCGCMPQMAPLFRRVLRSGPAPSGASAASGAGAGNGYSAAYDSSATTPGGAGKKSVIQTTVKGLHHGRGEASRPNHHHHHNRAMVDDDLERASDSSEMELNSIAVRTAIDQEVSAGGGHEESLSHHSGSTVARM